MALVIESVRSTARGRGRHTRYDRTFPDLNDIVSAYKRHWSAGAAQKRDYTALVRDLAVVTGQPRWTEPVKVMFVWVEENGERDFDNVRSAAKFILDGLVEAGVLEDDDPAHVSDLRDRYEIDPARPRVEVHVTPLDAPEWTQD